MNESILPAVFPFHSPLHSLSPAVDNAIKKALEGFNVVLSTRVGLFKSFTFSLKVPKLDGVNVHGIIT
jgi:hypothetical protein